MSNSSRFPDVSSVCSLSPVKFVPGRPRLWTNPPPTGSAAPADNPVARLVIGTHKALEQDLSDTVDSLAASGVVERVVSVLRVEGD